MILAILNGKSCKDSVHSCFPNSLEIGYLRENTNDKLILSYSLYRDGDSNIPKRTEFFLTFKEN